MSEDKFKTISKKKFRKLLKNKTNIINFFKCQGKLCFIYIIISYYVLREYLWD